MSTSTSMGFIRRNYSQVLERIQRAASRAGRQAGSVKLVVVTKTHPLEMVAEAVAAGATCLGENYAEEAIPKIEGLSSDRKVKWHMIGHVQSRKAGLVAQYFDFVHSIDSLKLAGKIDRAAGELGKVLPALIECNLAGEETKYGWPVWRETEWESLLNELRLIISYRNLAVCGLMGMAPYFSEAEAARPFFQRLRRFQEFLFKRLPEGNWQELSIGMSGDYEVAIEEGATWVRIGTSIFGPRNEI